MLDSLLNELICTARPWNASDYDHSCHRDNLVLITTAGRNSDTISLWVKDKVVSLVDRMIDGFETQGQNNWRAHNHFCLAVQKILLGFQRGEVELE